MILNEKERVSLSRFIEIYLSDPDRANLSEKTLIADGLALRNLKYVLGDILIYGKGNKERLVPLIPDAIEEKKDIGKIFRYGSGSTVSNYFRKIVRTVGVQARFHDLRHYVELSISGTRRPHTCSQTALIS